MVYDGLWSTLSRFLSHGVKREEQKRMIASAQVNLHTAKPSGFLIAIVVTSDKIASWLKQFYDVCGCRLQSTDPLPQTSDVKGNIAMNMTRFREDRRDV